MKKIVFIFATIIVLFLLLPVCIFLLRVPICKGKFLSFIRPHVQFFCPPKDLYDPILNEKIDISESDKIQKFKFVIKYVGQYAAIIVLDGLDSELYRKPYDLKLKIKLNFYKDDILLISKNTADYYKASWGLGHGDGEIKCEFESPKDIPLDTNIICEAIILDIDPYLNNHFADARLFVHKYSEE